MPAKTNVIPRFRSQTTNNAWNVDTVAFIELASGMRWREIRDWMPQSWEVEVDLSAWPKQDENITLFGSMGKHPDELLIEKEQYSCKTERTSIYHQLGFASFEAYRKFKEFLCHYEENRQKRIASERFVHKFKPKPSKKQKCDLPPVIPTKIIAHEN